MLLDLDAGKLLQSTTFQHKTAIYKSPLGEEVYRLTSKEGLFRLRQLSVREAFELYVQKRSVGAALELVKQFSGLWDLAVLQKLCTLVFKENLTVPTPLLEAFTSILAKLEADAPVTFSQPPVPQLPDPAFMSLFTAYSRQRRIERQVSTEKRTRRRALEAEKQQAAEWLGAVSWPAAADYWPQWNTALIAPRQLAAGLALHSNRRIRAMVQRNLQTYGNLTVFAVKNRSVFYLFHIQRVIFDLRRYLRVAVQSFDRESYAVTKSSIVSLSDLLQSIL